MKTHPHVSKFIRLARRLKPAGRRKLRACVRPSERRGLLNDAVAAYADLNVPEAGSAAQNTSTATSAREEHYRAITNSIQIRALEEMDSLSAANTIQVRYPFWDKRVIEYCLSLPAEQKCKSGWNRVVMRRAMSGVLPEAVRWRRFKTEFKIGRAHV